MSYTATQLTTFFTNANIGIAPTAAQALLISAYAQQDQAGSLTDAQTLANVLAFSQSTTDVALNTYQFFTGSSPTYAGLQYLVNGTTNPNDLSSTYYTGFNTENRYYNFAINLATGAGAGATAFAAAYSGVTFAQAVAGAYEQIVGTVNVGATAAAAAVAAITADQSYFAAVAASRAPGVNQDLATKAVMIGYILEEAQKSDVGYYAKAVDAFNVNLANNGANAVTGNLIALYDGRTVALTSGTDNFVGNAFADTISGTVNGNATTTTLTTADTVNGGGGADVLNIQDLGTGATFAIPVFNISNTATVNITSPESLTTVNSTTWTGTTALGITSTEAFGVQAIAAGSGTAITMTESDAIANGIGGDVTIAGGSSVAFAETLTNSTVSTTSAAGAVIVNGGPGTTSVSVSQAAPVTATSAVGGVTDGAVRITDANSVLPTKAGLITSVSLNNFAAGALITDNNDANLTLSGNGGAVTLTATAATLTSTTLALNLNGVSAASLTDTNNEITTINAALGASSSVTGITDTGLKTLNISGTGTLSLTAIGASVTALTVAGAAGLGGAAGTPLDISGTGVTAFAPTSTGTINVKLGATQTFTGGAGTDVITLAADATKAVTAGSATNNEVILNNAAVIFTAANTFTNVTGFQILGVQAFSSGSFDLSKLPTVKTLDVQATGNSVIFTKVAAGTTLLLDGAAITQGVTYQTSDATGAADSATVNIGVPTETAGITVAGQVTLEDSTLAGIGTLALNSQGVANTTTPYVNTLSSLNDSGLTSLTVAGPNGLTITSLTDNASSVSITNSTGGAVAIGGWTSSQLTSLTLTGGVALTLTDSAAGAVTVAAGSDNSNVSLTLNGHGTHALTLGNGTNTIADAGNTGADVISVGTGANTITTGTGANSITIGASGTKAETIVLTAGATANTITLGAHTTGVDAVSVAAGAGISAVINGLNTGTTSADTITFLGDNAAAGGVNVVTSTTINNYANAHALDSTQLTTAIAAALDIAAHGGGNTAQHGIAEFTFQGNTYLVEQANGIGTAFAATDTVVELVGVNTVTVLSTAAAGVLGFHG